ncbi:hypothetical protein PVL29_025539 [Vitis rotundifolia]|uniref:Uncharacterized protein n=1 Tax=Vitis rotundifolia TaxID=103349 RepID=A0AA39D6K7_VITRO|nr:hypothetical protein PVL29_025539 [Vitis rotundifolia]
MGGGVMRTAAKVAGVGVVNAGLRGAPAVQPVEQPMAAAARKATVPVSSVVSSAKLGDAPVAVQRPSWELDDWEFASVVEEINVGTGEPLPRVVFGGVPTLQEAKEATSELKDALDQLYLSPSRSIGSGVQQLGLLQIANSDHLETKACVATAENTVATVPAHAIQAFAFLKDSPAAQNVVASIASDPNVWSAVMQNEALVDFLQAQKTCEHLVTSFAVISALMWDASKLSLPSAVCRCSLPQYGSQCGGICCRYWVSRSGSPKEL